MNKKDIKATPVDPELEEKMAQKLEKDFDGNQYYGASLETERQAIIDPGSGKPVILRQFDFKMNPDTIRTRSFPNDKQAVFNAHAKQIATLLWGDGLRPYEGVGPRVIIDTKRHSYKIIVAAEPRLNTMVIERPSSLNELLKPKKNGSPRH